MLYFTERDVLSNKIRWVKMFKQVTGCGLRQGKFTADLLELRGYICRSESSIIAAAVAYNKWLKECGGDEELLLANLHRAIEIIRRSNAGLISVADSMAYDKI